MTEKEYSPSAREKKLNQRKIEKTDVNVNLKNKEKEISKRGENENKEKKKPAKVEIKPKEKAFVNGNSMRLSLKHCKWICRMIKGKTPEKAIEMLTEVVNGKRAVPMPTLEVGHRKGKGMAGGRFPRKASLEIINLLKQVGANANVSMVENPVIVIAKANKASMPFKRNRRRAKRCHVYIEVKDKTKIRKKK